MNRERIHYTIDKKLMEYIDQIKEEKNYKSKSQALEFIIKEHKKNNYINMDTIVDIVGDRIAEKINNNMLMLKKSNNNIDRNMQVLLEMMNGFYIKENFPNIFTTDEEEHIGYVTAKKAVDNRIERQRLLKLQKEFNY